MDLENKTEFIKVSGIFDGLKIPVEYRGKWAVCYNGRVFGAYTLEQVCEINRLIRRYDEKSSPLLLDIPTEEEEKRENAYPASAA